MAARIERAYFQERKWEEEIALGNIDTYHMVNFLPEVESRDPTVAHYLITTTLTETKIERFEDYDLIRIKKNIETGRKVVMSDKHVITTLTRNSERPFVLTIREGPNQQRRIIRIMHR